MPGCRDPLWLKLTAADASGRARLEAAVAKATASDGARRTARRRVASLEGQASVVGRYDGTRLGRKTYHS